VILTRIPIFTPLKENKGSKAAFIGAAMFKKKKKNLNRQRLYPHL
jgi:hypothetical protein